MYLLVLLTGCGTDCSKETIWATATGETKTLIIPQACMRPGLIDALFGGATGPEDPVVFRTVSEVLADRTWRFSGCVKGDLKEGFVLSDGKNEVWLTDLSEQPDEVGGEPPPFAGVHPPVKGFEVCGREEPPGPNGKPAFHVFGFYPPKK